MENNKRKVKSGKDRQPKGFGGLNKRKDSWEGTLEVKKQNGDIISKSFTRHTIAEINHIKYQLKALEPLDNDVLDIKINKNTNEITLIQDKDLIASVNQLDPNITVDEYVDYWLWNHRRRGEKGTQIKDSTFGDYVQKSQHIKDKLGTIKQNGKEYKVKVRDLTFNFIERQMLELYEEVAENTVKQVRNHIYNMMVYARKDGIIKENPLQDETINFPTSKNKFKRKIIEETDIQSVMQYCLKHWFIDVLTQLLTGGRVSEIRGLVWEDIDEDKCEITFSRNYLTTKKYNVDEQGHIQAQGTKSNYSTLKSSSSYRTIKIDEEFMKILMIHKELQKEQASKSNKTFKRSDPVFTGRWYGKQLGRNTTNDRVKQVMNDLKIKDFEEITSHCLRKSFCCAGLLNDVPVEYMAKLLGHSDPKVTLRILCRI